MVLCPVVLEETAAVAQVFGLKSEFLLGRPPVKTNDRALSTQVYGITFSFPWMDSPEKAERAPTAPVWNQSFPSLRHSWYAMAYSALFNTTPRSRLVYAVVPHAATGHSNVLRGEFSL